MRAPKLFSMTLTPYVDAVLVFDAEESGEYEVYSLAPADAERIWSEWESMRAGLTPTGRIPIGDVEFDEAAGFRIRTLGLERFARNA